MPVADLNARWKSLAPSRARFLLLSSLLTSVLAVSAGRVLLWCDPSRSPFYPACHFHRLTGLLCPGCGSLRAMHQLLHGRLAAAFHFNALLVLSLPWLGWLAARSVIRLSRNQPVAAGIRPVWLWCALAVALAFGVLRNLPLPQAGWLGLRP